MGFCDITTYTGTAGVLGIIQSLYGLGFNIFLLEVLFRKIIVGPRGYINIDKYEFHFLAWNAESGDAIKGLSVTATVLNSLWLLISIALLIAHPRRKVGWLWAWVATTSVIIVVDFCMSIGVAVIVARKLIDLNAKQAYATLSDPLFARATAVVVLAFNRFGIVSLILNIYYTVSVSRRAKEIRLQDTQKLFRQQFAQIVAGAPVSSAQTTVGAVPPVPYGNTFMLQTYQPTPVQVPGLYPDFRGLPAQVNERVQPPDNPYLPPTAPHPQGHPGSDPSESFHKNHL